MHRIQYLCPCQYQLKTHPMSPWQINHGSTTFLKTHKASFRAVSHYCNWSDYSARISVLIACSECRITSVLPASIKEERNAIPPTKQSQMDFRPGAADYCGDYWRLKIFIRSHKLPVFDLSFCRFYSKSYTFLILYWNWNKKFLNTVKLKAHNIVYYDLFIHSV